MGWINNIIDHIDFNVILGEIFSGLVIGFFSYIGVKATIKSENKRYRNKIKMEEYSSKPEFVVSKANFSANDQIDLTVFVTGFDTSYDKDDNDFKFLYDKEIFDKRTHIYHDYIFENIGKNAANEFYLIVTHQKDSSIIEYDDLNMLLDKGLINYACNYDKKIFPNEKIKIRLVFSKEKHICYPLSCTLALNYKDQYGNCWEQPFWYEKDNIYEPFIITRKDFIDNITITNALDCFKNPYLW